MSDTLDVQSVVATQAWTISRKYGGYVEAEDLQQEGWLWIVEHPEKMKEHEEEPNVRLAASRLGRDIWGCMDRYARREKSSRSGYEPEDDIYFSDAMVGLVLPSVLKDDPTPPSRDGERIANTSDPAEGGTWLVTYLDMKQAWNKAKLSDDQRALMISYYRDEYTQQEIADMLGVTQQSVAKRLKTARARLIDRLGGYQPREFNADPEQRPGVKRNSSGIVSQVK